MQTKVINPYIILGNKHRESLDYIIANLQPNPEFVNLNDQLVDSFYIPDPQDPGNLFDIMVPVLRTLLPHAYNGYVNGGLSDCIPAKDGIASAYCRYNAKQMLLVRKMLEGLNNVPPESIGIFLDNIEMEAVAGALSYREQVPLLAALANGRADWEYWTEQIATPGAWSVYLNADIAISTARLAGYVSASLQGALLGYGLAEPPRMQLVNIYTATAASTGLAAGKVIFGWVGN